MTRNKHGNGKIPPREPNFNPYQSIQINEFLSKKAEYALRAKLHLGNVNKLNADKNLSYVRPHEIEVLFAAEFDPTTDSLARVQHLFSAGPVATLTVKLNDGQFLDVELSRKHLAELSLSVGDEVAVRPPPPEPGH